METASNTPAPVNKGKPETRRLFIAIACPPLPSIVTLLRDLRALPAEAGLSIVGEDRLHLTLKFIGSVSAELIPRIITVLEQQLANTPPFTLRLKGSGCFSSVLWLGVETCAALTEIATRLNLALGELGFPADARAFVPHVTVAWLKRDYRFERAAWVSRTREMTWGRVEVDSVRLYESRTLPEGAQYNVLHEVRLKEPVESNASQSGNVDQEPVMKTALPEVLRTLDLDPLTHPRGKAFMSSASSLVCVGRQVYVIADDEHHLGHFQLGTAVSVTTSVSGAASHAPPVQLLRLFDGTLPADKGKRKKAKPDLESLALLPALDGFPFGALLALGSGSRPNRCRAVLLALDQAGYAGGPAQLLDLAELYAPLHEHFGDLNIEGAFVDSGSFHLLNRGNKRHRESARISFAWPDVVAWLAGNGAMPAPVVTGIQDIDLGLANGVPLSLTDAVALGGGAWAFCAVAESTNDSYHDGDCVASVAGIVDAQGNVSRMCRLQGNPKVEGIALEGGEGLAAGGTGELLVQPIGAAPEVRLLLVTDADDPDRAAQLLRVTLPR